MHGCGFLPTHVILRQTLQTYLSCYIHYKGSYMYNITLILINTQMPENIPSTGHPAVATMTGPVLSHMISPPANTEALAIESVRL